jgi:tetraacyldisaccharide 4'-kinase
MQAPSFWWKDKGTLAMCLTPLATLYGALSGMRMRQTGFHTSVPVICVGNCVVGGAGKTPTALFIATALTQRGFRPVFLSRGYGGSLAGPVRVALAGHGPDMVGDEALLLAAQRPTIVSRDRIEGARLASTVGDVIIMDDGLQNPTLAKDYTIAIVDAERGFGNGLCIPAGPLRAPLLDQWPLIDSCLVIGDDAENARALSADFPVPTGFASFQPDPAIVMMLQGQPCLAFAGIGNPDKFFRTLRMSGIDVQRTRSFADHYVYQRDDILALLDEAKRQGLQLVTTEKDYVKIAKLPGIDLNLITALPVTLALRDERALIDNIVDAIRTRAA